MAWDDDMVTIVRVMVNDPSSTVYTDASLTELILVAAFQVKMECSFTQTYTVSISDETISPDPTLEATKDESFINLVCLKAASIADHGAAILAARRAISVRDGSSAIDLRGPLAGWLKLLEKGWRAAYEKAKLEYQMGQTPIAGAAVMTPFRTWASSDGRAVYVFDADRSPT